MKTKSLKWLLSTLPLSLAILLGVFMFQHGCQKDKMLPRVWTLQVNDVTKTSMTVQCDVSSSGGETVTERGIWWGTGSSPTVGGNKSVEGSGTGIYTSSVSGLEAGTLYYVQAYATSDAGTAYGAVMSGRTMNGSVTDIEGNTYYTVLIGGQEWMAGNLKTTRMNDDTQILHESDPASWGGLTEPAYTCYGNSADNIPVYGMLYNGYAVRTGKLCPEGWHVPSRDEWDLLIGNLGGRYRAGGKLKEAGMAHWAVPNEGASNECGFRALPGGTLEFISGDGGGGGGGCAGPASYSTFGLGQIGIFWSSTHTASQFDSTEFYAPALRFDSAGVYAATGFFTNGRSVRCLKDR